MTASKRGRPRERVYRPARPGTFVLEGGASWVVDGVTWLLTGFTRHPENPGVLMCVCRTDDGVVHRPWGELVVELFRAGLLQPPQDPAGVPLPRCVAMDRLNDEQRDYVLSLRSHLCEAMWGTKDASVLGPGVGPLNPLYDTDLHSMMERFETKSAELTRLRFPRGTSAKALYAKYRRLEAEGLVGLIPKPWLNDNDPREGLDDKLLDEIGDFVRMMRTKSTRQNRSRVRLLKVHLRRAAIDDLPADERLRRVLAFCEAGLHMDSRSKTRREQANRPTDAHGHMVVTRPGEIIQIDMTPGTGFAFDPIYGAVTYEILTAIDVYDKEVVAVRVCPTGHSSRDLKLLMFDLLSPVIRRTGWSIDREGNWRGQPRQLVMGKRLISFADRKGDDGPHDEREAVEPVLDDDGEAVEMRMRPVRPTVVVIDHGRTGVNAEFLGLCAEIGTEVMFARPGVPTDKPYIESHHMPTDQAQQVLPAYKGASNAERGEAPELEARLTIAEIEQALWETFVLVRSHVSHAGNRDPDIPHIALAPSEKFAEYLESGGYIEWPIDPNRIFDFLNTFTSTIQDDGVRLDNFYYDAPSGLWPAPLRRRTQQPNATPQTFAYDRNDRSCIYWFDDTNNQWHRIHRKHSGNAVEAPFSEIRSNAALQYALRNRKGGISVKERNAAIDDISFRWSKHVYVDQREARLAAIDEARVRSSRRDRALWEKLVQDATPEPADLDRPVSDYLSVAAAEYAFDEADDDDWDDGIG